jgi:hypothetical protein
MARKIGMIFVVAMCTVAIASAQTVPSQQMTLDEFRHYLDVMHIKEADERGVRAQMKVEATQLPVWWPSQVTDLMITSMLQVDYLGLNYAYVKGCASSHDIGLLTAIFSTPAGQQYVAKVTGSMVEQEGKGVSPMNARDAEIDHDTGLPAGSMQGLSAPEKEQVKVLLSGGALDCMNSGYKKASVDITDARTKAARAVIAEHRDEITRAKTKYEAAHPAPGK